MEESEFIFDSVDLLYYKLHKMSFYRGESLVDSPKWLKNKKQQSMLRIMMINAFNML